MEKAHGDVFNIMLQLLDDGRLTDSKGNVVNFCNTIVVFTSNIGSSDILDVAGDPDRQEEMRHKIMENVRQSFRPEFVNRIDEFVTFNSLGTQELRRIVEIELKRLSTRASSFADLVATPEALDYIAEVGYDVVYGARPLKRSIQREIETPLAKLILSGNVAEEDTVLVYVENDRLALNVTQDAKIDVPDAALDPTPVLMGD